MSEPENTPEIAVPEEPSRSGREGLRLLGERVKPLASAHERTLPVLAPLQGLFAGGALQRGWVVATGGDGATSLALAVAAGPSTAGSWTAVVGDPGLGLVAAAEAGVALERLLVVSVSGPRAAAEATAALVGSVDVVLVGPGISFGATDHRRLVARLRERGSVLIRPGGDGSRGADVFLQIVSSRWCGLGDGWGLLRSRRVSVRVQGRGAASLGRSVDLLLPGPDGSPVLAEPPVVDPAVRLPPAQGYPDAGKSAVVA